MPEESALPDDDLDDRHGDDSPRYRPTSEIEPNELPASFGGLIFFDDPYLRMQAHNLAAVDGFLNQIEDETLKKLFREDGTPDTAFFLAALTQMWIFAAYELMRTWRERTSAIVKWADHGGLKMRLESVEAKRTKVPNYGREDEINRLREAIDHPVVIERARLDLRRTHIAFSQIEFIRIALAKHQVRGRDKVPARAPGYGRINHWCGAIEYELGKEEAIFGFTNRRDIAESLRFMTQGEPPSEDDIASYEAFLAGP